MHRSRAYIATLLAVLLTMSLVSAAFGVTQSELDETRHRAEEARQAAEEADRLAATLRTEVEALDAKISALSSEVKALDPQIAEATTRSKQLQAEVTSLRAQITQKEAEIEHTQAEYDVQKQLLEARMTESYKQGDLFYLDLLLGSKNFGDLIARTTLVQRVVESNRDVAVGLDTTKRQLQKARAELDRTLQTVQTKRAEAELVEKRLRDMRGERQSKLNAQTSIQNQKSDLMAETEANADRLRELAAEEEAEAARIAAQLAAMSSGGSGAYSGVMAFPVPGGYVTSPFGWRYHPIFGTQKFHTGIDIGSGGGADIIAAGDGTVLSASYGWNGGFGNRLWIDHGDGLVSTYNHLLDGGILVSVGQSVTKGQHIAEMGSTGYSTGPHLHFETRVNGEPVDPMGYLQ
jgi:murein DD-endopeptidase MepM/ murein hydrolase activator NlpD